MRHLVDHQLVRSHDRLQARPPGDQEPLLAARAVVDGAAPVDDVAHAERAQPVLVGPRAEAAVEHLVLREVVLAEPAARERDPRLRQVDRGPVVCRVDGLDAVAGGQVRAEVVDRGLPLRRAERRVCAALHERGGERRHVPEHGEDDRRRRPEKRPPVAQRQREHRERDRREAHAGDVLPDRRRHEEDDEAGDRVDDEERP